MMHLRGLVLFTLFLLGAARRSVLIGNSHHNAEQHTNTLSQALEGSVEALETGLPRGFWATLLALAGASVGDAFAVRGPPLRTPPGAVMPGTSAGPVAAAYVPKIQMNELTRKEAAASFEALSADMQSTADPGHWDAALMAGAVSLGALGAMAITDLSEASKFLGPEAATWMEQVGADLSTPEGAAGIAAICGCATLATQLVNAALGLPATQQVPEVPPGVGSGNNRSSGGTNTDMPSFAGSELLLNRGRVVALALQAAAIAVADPAYASYALYQASQQDYTDRKATGFKPVATSDTATLSQIQADIERKKGATYTKNKAKKAPQYCAGQTSSVSPMMENICQNIGASKADQTNTRKDAFGNMVVGNAMSVDDYERLQKKGRK